MVTSPPSHSRTFLNPGLEAATADQRPAPPSPPRADTANRKRQTAPSPVAENRGAAGGRAPRGPAPARDPGRPVRAASKPPGPRRAPAGTTGAQAPQVTRHAPLRPRTANQHAAGFEPSPEGGQLLSGVVRAMAATTAAHTCWAEVPLGDNDARYSLAGGHGSPSLSAAENITTWTSGRRRRTWPRTPRTRQQRDPMPPPGRRQTGRYSAREHACTAPAVLGRAVAYDFDRRPCVSRPRPPATPHGQVAPANHLPPHHTSGPTGPDQPESTIAPTRAPHAALYFHTRLTIRCRTSAAAKTATPRQRSPHPS
jgi:hypothetical protein